MTKLEQIALNRVVELVTGARERCSAKNVDRMNGERLFIEKELKESLEIIEAIQDNNETVEKRVING
jgi:hypothetical protein